jgi:hypothetical protein
VCSDEALAISSPRRLGGSHLPNPTPLNPEARKVRNQDHSPISHGAKTLKEINVKNK